MQLSTLSRFVCPSSRAKLVQSFSFWTNRRSCCWRCVSRFKGHAGSCVFNNFITFLYLSVKHYRDKLQAVLWVILLNEFLVPCGVLSVHVLYFCLYSLCAITISACNRAERKMAVILIFTYVLIVFSVAEIFTHFYHCHVTNTLSRSKTLLFWALFVDEDTFILALCF